MNFCYIFLPDINECIQGSDTCDHTCINTVGAYKCSCNTGFVLDNSFKKCVPSCGGNFSTLSGSFQTPGWPYFYPSLDFNCQWLIDLDNDSYIIRFITDTSAYGIHGNGKCPTDYVAFYDGPNSSAPPLGKFCFLFPPPAIISTSYQAMVLFQASSHIHTRSRVGVRIFYQAIRLGKYAQMVLLFYLICL